MLDVSAWTCPRAASLDWIHVLWRIMERTKEESKLPAPCVLWPVELKLTHIDCRPENKLVHFQGQYMTICELDYNILQVEIQNAVKSKVSVQVGDVCLVEDSGSGRWYRGRVQNIEKDKFHIFLLDHGDMMIVGPNCLSSISDTLLMLPPKIVCGFFANILPIQSQWDSLTNSYFSSLKGSRIKGYIHARLPYHILILEVPEINSDMIKKRLGRHVDTSTFLLLVEMLIDEPIPQSNESVPDLLIEKQIGQEYCLKSSSLLGFEEILSLNGPKLKVGQEVEVVVAAAVNPGLFYCRLSSMGKDLQEMSDKLALACESGSGCLTNDLDENLGLLCAVKGKDEKWHRGFVECLPLNSQVKVVFVDSGYCESVKVENILQLPSEFLSRPIMAFPCSLSCLEKQDEDIKNQQVDALKTGLLGKVLEIEIDDFRKDQNLYLVTMNIAQKHSGKQAGVKPHESDNLRSNSNFPYDVLSNVSAGETKVAQTSDSNPNRAIPDDSFFEGYVVHVQSPKHFWIRTKEHNPNFENMTKEMADYFSKLQLHEEVFEDLVPGALCCAMYENDMQYYRALVVDTLDKGAEVFFIDFGNTEKVPGILIKKLPKKFAIHPEFAMECALAHVAPHEDIWTTTASNYFREVTSDKTLMIHVVHRKNRKYVVDLFERDAENCSIATIMTTAKMALDWRYNPALAAVEMERPCKYKGNALSKKKNKKDLRVVTFHKVTSSMSSPNQIEHEWEPQNYLEKHTPSETSKPEVVPAKTLKPMHFKPGSEVSVICSHVNTPSDFWCQNVSTKLDLDKLMEEMQLFYQTYTSGLLMPALCCAVKSPHDNQWHRACMIGQHNEELLMILVDVGLIIQEKLQNIQTLQPQFLELPTQAFRCKLNFIEPIGGSSWSSEACNLLRDFLFKCTSSKCRIYSQVYEKGKGLLNIVSIHTPLQQASTYLVEKGVAAEVQAPDKHTISSAHPWSFVYSSFNISCESEELVHVTYVCSPWEIYFQLDRNTEILNRLTERVAEESQLFTSISDNCSSKVCLAKYFCDGSWYRALVHPVQSNQHVSVVFVDYGNKEIAEKTNVMAIPTTAVDILLTPMQALRCSLLNLPEGEHLPEVNKWLETEILNKSFKAKFVASDNNGHFVCDLYDGNLHINEKVKELMAAHGVAQSDPAVNKLELDFPKEEAHASLPNCKRNHKATRRSKAKQNGKQTPRSTNHSKKQLKEPVEMEDQNAPCPLKVVPSHQSLPKLCDLPAVTMKPGSRGVGFVSHSNSAGSFFIQMEDDEPKLLQMIEELNGTNFKDKRRNVETEIKVGDLVAAEYEEDLALYRAVVTNVSNSDLLAVEFIDYGNTATVDRKNVHMLTNTFLSQPRLSMACTLAKPHPFKNDYSFTEKAVGKPLLVEFIQSLEGSWEVNIEFDDDHLQGDLKYDADHSKDVDLASQDKLPKDSQTQSQSDQYNQSIEVQSFQQKEQFSHQLANNQTVRTFQQKTTSNTQSICEFKTKPTEVKTIQQKTKSNTQQRKFELTFATKQIKKAAIYVQTSVKTREIWRRKYKKQNFKPKVVVNAEPHCETSIPVTKISEGLQENVQQENENSESLACVALHDVKDSEPVKIYEDLSVVTDHPPSPKTSLRINLDPPQTLFQAPVKMNFEYEGFAAAVTTPSEFYIILEDLLLIADTVSSILENLPEVLEPLSEVHFVPGTSCLVKLVENQKWCRAEIVRCDSTSVLINLVDCGLYSVLSRLDASQLRKLPEELGRLPKVTYHCLLRGVKPNAPDWSDDAILFFQNSMCHKNLKIRFRQHVSETQWEVDIITGSQNLAKELVDSDHAMYIDKMLGIRFQQDQGLNQEPNQQAISSTVNDLSIITEHTSEAKKQVTLSAKKPSEESVGEKDTSDHLNSGGDDLGQMDRETLGLPSGIKQCMLM